MKKSFDDPGSADRTAFTLVEVMVVVGIIGILVGLLLPAVNSAREAARRSQCQNNLMQLGVALHSYDSVHETLPPGSVSELDPVLDLPRGYGFGWMAQILPYLEQANVFNHFNFQVGLYQPPNATTRTNLVRRLPLPFRRRSGAGHGPGGDDELRGGASRRRGADRLGQPRGPVPQQSRAIRGRDRRDVADALRGGEAARRAGARLGVGHPRQPAKRRDAGGRGSRRRRCGPVIAADPFFVGGFASAHPGLVSFLVGDGSVRYMKTTIAPRVMQRLTHRADGEPIDASTFGY